MICRLNVTNFHLFFILREINIALFGFLNFTYILVKYMHGPLNFSENVLKLRF